MQSQIMIRRSGEEDACGLGIEREGTNTIKVLVVDDDRLFLECLEYILSNDYNGFRIIGKTIDGSMAVKKVDEFKPNVVIMGLGTESDSGVAMTEAILEKFPNIKVIILSMSKDINVLSRVVRAGASAYLLKTCSIRELVESILAVASGACVLTPSMAGKLMEEFRQQNKNMQAQNFFSLSAREKEILQFAAVGASNKEIAEKCYISETTVKSHFRNILGKMEVRNRAGAVALATSKGLLPGVSRTYAGFNASTI